MAGEGADGDLTFVPLGGVGEIGMNLAVYGIGAGRRRRYIAVDMGVAFGHDNLPGIEAVLPDISWLEERADRLEGIFITHAHEDHFGALFDFWPRLKAPVYMTPFAAGLLEAKGAGEAGSPDIPVKVVKQGDRVAAGPFEVEFVPVSHSIPEPNALVIRSAAGTVVHTGDWKIDPTPGIGVPIDEARLAAIGEEGVHALVCDSTNALREGESPSEADVAEVLKDIIARASQRVCVTTFASNVGRLRSVAEAALAAEREVVIVGRAIQRAVEVATELGYLDGLPPFLRQDAYGYLPRDKVVALMTGSQGEPRAALARIVSGDHPAVAISKGDMVIFSSRTIPGNERPVNAIINGLINIGAEVVTDRLGLVHVSGHPRREELKRLYALTKPKVLVPVHGEALHLHEHAKLGRASGISEVLELRNGDLARLWPGPSEVISKIGAGQLYRDGRLLLEPERSGVEARRKLAFAGAVFVSLVMRDSGAIADDPELVLLGLPNRDSEGEPMQALLEDIVDETIEQLPKAKRRDETSLSEAVRRAVRSQVSQIWGKKPTVAVTVSYI
ncbi:ribonuclease J [Afifella sp. IM 167]|uniref:ribonuclease J n=1 Tax=Afifella sp. IM 167 TaxID=2033586 RepID=UPI001CC92F63|nr:ribonuclease J [Afifella sp. IM 167]MBZ8132284.1 MBL fold metallo-hydrolase [Afifella sp. IM 167]